SERDETSLSWPADYAELVFDTQMQTVHKPYQIAFNTGPSPLTENFVGFKKRILAGMEERLKHDWERAVAAAKAEFGRIDPEVRPEKLEEQHFTWFALFQCAEWSYRRLSDVLRIAEDTIRKGVGTIPDVLGLELRKPRRGRPLKTGIGR